VLVVAPIPDAATSDVTSSSIRSPQSSETRHAGGVGCGSLDRMRATLAVLVLMSILGGGCGDGDGGTAPPPPACRADLPAEPASTPYALRYDQLGYSTGARLWAVVLGAGQPAPRFRVYDVASRCWVADGTAGPRVVDAQSRAGTPLTGDRVDLSGIPGPGQYLVVLEDGARFGPITIGEAPYAPSITKLVAFLREQRCGATTAAISRHGACHLFASLGDGDPATHSGDGVAVDDGYAGSVTAQTGPAVDVEGGWHDAGDYIKFTGTTAFTLAVDLIALRDHRDALVRALGDTGYDELRRELRWGLDWLLAMLRGPTLYHQVSGERDHSGFRRPDDDTATPIDGYDQRPVFRFGAGRGANILGRAAAAFAAGAQVFADDPAYAAELLDAARRVYAAGKGRPAAQNPVPEDFYGEGSYRDDLALGAAALARVTGEDTFRAEALDLARKLEPRTGEPIYWGGVDALALLETALAYPADAPERAELAARLGSIADPILASDTAPRGAGGAFGYALEHFGNGTIEQSLGAACVCLAARRLGGHDGCLEVARSQLHWLFGLNPFGESFQIGVGTQFPQRPHHGLASTAGLVLDGAIVGGPTAIDEIDGWLPVPGADDPFARWSTDALFYQDSDENWVVNEPAIDFTAPLVFAIAELAEEE